MFKPILFALAAFSVGCTALSLAPATEPAAASATIVAPLGANVDTSWLKNGKIRVQSNMCQDISGHYNIGYNDCQALVMLGDCVPAPNGTCDCSMVPLQQTPPCANITNGSGVFQWD